MNSNKITVVTISFNQVAYLRACIESVLSQDYSNFEYIIVDPGSTDGSRELIMEYGDRVIPVFQKDKGPADGLNIGFARATGDIFCYLNSDDVFLPGALKAAVKYFEKLPLIDVIYGNSYVIDELGNRTRRCYSDRFSLGMAAYGCAVVIQPSTFFRSESYKRVSGFNISNKSNWDGEIFIDMVLAGASAKKVNDFLSCYRVHAEGITGSGRLIEMHRKHALNMFRKIKKRDFNSFDSWVAVFLRLLKHLGNPRATYERVRYGAVFSSRS